MEYTVYLPIPSSPNDGRLPGYQALGRGVWTAPLLTTPSFMVI